MFCSLCGAAVETPQSRFCGHCGTPVVPSVPAVISQPRRTPAEQGDYITRVAGRVGCNLLVGYLVSLIVLFVIAMLVLFFIMTPTPQSSRPTQAPKHPPIGGKYAMTRRTRWVPDNGQTQDLSRTGWLEVVEQPGGKFNFKLNADLVVDGASANIHTGDLEGEAEVQNSVAVYAYDRGEYDKCRITMKFAPGKIELTQEQTCGFGTGVDANGTYVKVAW